MADRYLDHFLHFLLPHRDFPIVTWFLHFTSHSLPTLMSKKRTKTKNNPRPPPAKRKEPPPEAEPEALANSPSPPPSSTITDTLPKGGRKGNRPEEELGSVANKAGDAVQPLTGGGLSIPGETKGDTEGKESLKIKIHLNLHAKVRLDLDAQIYGDVVIGLL